MVCTLLFIAALMTPIYAKTSQEIAALPPKAGLCRAMMTRYYVNADAKECQTFTFGGCGGNANNFETLEECKKVLHDIIPEKVEPKESHADEYDLGEVEAEATSPEKYNADLDVYKPEEYQVEPTNENKKSPSCEEIAAMPPAAGLCRARLPRYYVNIRTRSCETFVYGGCGGNKNNFETLRSCEKVLEEVLSAKKVSETTESHYPNSREVAAMPPVTGHCRAALTRYFVNLDTGKCETFTYGGCGGNLNNFKTKELCESVLRNTTPTMKVSDNTVDEYTASAHDILKLPRVVGLCRRALPRFYANAE